MPVATNASAPIARPQLRCARSAAAAGAAPLTTTWIGGSAVGTEVMPRLVRAYAASIGATTTMSVGSDPRNLEFKILASDGRLLGQVNANRLGVTPGFPGFGEEGSRPGMDRAPHRAGGGADDDGGRHRRHARARQ